MDAPAPAAPAAPEAPSVEMNVSAFEAALASPPGKEATAPATDKPAPAEKPAADKSAADKPAADQKPAAEDKAKKKGLDALPDEEVEKKPDAEEKPPVEEEPEIDTKNWAKAQRDAFAAARVKAKLLATERDDARMKVAELQKQLAEQKPKDSEQTLKELEELRTWKHARDVRDSPEWKAQVVEPIDKVFAELDRLAVAAGIPPEKLREATDAETKVDRIKAIKAVFDSAEEPVYPEFVAEAISESNKLPSLYAKMDELEAKASEVWSSLQNQTAAQKEAAAKAAEAKYLESHNHIAEQLKRKLPSLFADVEVAKDIAEARPSEDPADVAFATQAAVLLPKVVGQLQALKAEIAKLKESEAALLGSRGTVEKVTEPARRENTGDDMDEDALQQALRAGK